MISRIGAAFLARLAKDGRLLLLFDGLDEVATEKKSRLSRRSELFWRRTGSAGQ